MAHMGVWCERSPCSISSSATGKHIISWVSSMLLTSWSHRGQFLHFWLVPHSGGCYGNLACALIFAHSVCGWQYPEVKPDNVPWQAQTFRCLCKFLVQTRAPALCSYQQWHRG